MSSFLLVCAGVGVVLSAGGSLVLGRVHSHEHFMEVALLVIAAGVWRIAEGKK